MMSPTYNDDEYQKLVTRMSTPRVLIDNMGCSNATRIMIDSARKQGILLEEIQVLTDLNLSIKKAYICSDGRWSMNVFHVTDLNGNKLTDDSAALGDIEKALEKVHYGKPKTEEGPTVLELTGTDRVGLLSEVFAVLSDLNCNVVNSTVWTHNGRIASIIYLNDNKSDAPIKDTRKLEKIEAMLRNVLKGDNNIRSSKTSIAEVSTHTERRLHQMMFADRDYDRKRIIDVFGESPVVLVQHYLEKDYSVVNIHCKDRNKLLLDVVCTLTDMQYLIFHATVDTSADQASLEFFIRHMDGTPLNSEAETDCVILCLRAAIERRESQGVALELCAEDRKWLLADVMRIFRENGLNVTRAEIATLENKSRNIFYVTDSIGNRADPKIIQSVREKIGLNTLRVKELPISYQEKVDRDESPPRSEVQLTSVRVDEVVSPDAPLIPTEFLLVDEVVSPDAPLIPTEEDDFIKDQMNKQLIAAVAALAGFVGSLSTSCWALYGNIVKPSVPCESKWSAISLDMSLGCIKLISIYIISGLLIYLIRRLKRIGHRSQTNDVAYTFFPLYVLGSICLSYTILVAIVTVALFVQKCH